MADKLNYSPKLRAAADEIKAILIREDIAGIILLHDVVGRDPKTGKLQGDFEGEGYYVEGMTEYLVHLTPSYSMLLPEPQKGGFRFRDVGGDHPNPIQRQIRMAPTYNLVETFTDLLGQFAMMFINLSDNIKKNIIPGKPGKHHRRE